MMTCEHAWVVVGHGTDPQPTVQLQCTFCLEVADLLPNPDEWDSYLRYISDAANQWYHDEMHGRQPDAPADFFAHEFDDLVDQPAECDHTWLVQDMADVDDAVMEIDGYLDLMCGKCGQRARILRPTYAECWQVTKDWLFDSVAYWRGGDGGRLVLLEDEPPPPAVADLVNVLELFEGEDDGDIPF